MGFCEKFLWGVATSSCQIEGAYTEDGKSLNIWDVAGNRIADLENANVACDHYHRFVDDIKIMKKLGIKSYRFSISWARIFPNDDEKINEKGINFYRSLILELKKADIEPLCTLYHWDMPLWVYEKGGFKNREIVSLFENFTKVCVENFSDMVKYWFTINEPQCFVGSGYYRGWHAPFLCCSDVEIETVTKNVMLCHGVAVKTIRKYSKLKPIIGFAPTASLIMPTPNGKIDEKKAKKNTFDINRGKVFSCAWWSDPMVLGKIPKGMEFLTKEDIKEICQPLDFYAFNIYNPVNSSFNDLQEDLIYQGMPRTSIGWEIVPDCLYYAAKFFFERYKLPIMVSENGMANSDFIYSDGKVYDPQREEYIKMHLKALKRAADEKIPIVGYQYWSFMDNFEWTLGYKPRFGLVYVDYKTQKRIIKESAKYYSQVIKTNGEKL